MLLPLTCYCNFLDGGW